MTVLRQGLNTFLSFSPCEDKSWLEWHGLWRGLWWLQREARDVRGGDRETGVDGCFTGKELHTAEGGGVRVHMYVRVCERDKERKLVWYCEYMRNIKDLKLNKRGHESGCGEWGGGRGIKEIEMERAKWEHQSERQTARETGMKKSWDRQNCFHKSRQRERERDRKVKGCFAERPHSCFKVPKYTAEKGGNAWNTLSRR